MNNNTNAYQSNMISILNQYLSNIAVMNVKLYNFHWNVVGPFFFGLHPKLQQYFEQTTQMYDQVAERIKMLSGYPITNLPMYEQTSTIKSVESKDYTEKEILQMLIRDFEVLLAMTYETGNLAAQRNSY